eukprot:TRINITY_DN2890_c0_g1_i1.p1 TRINITY_DN2890_c0_g1~~TRINITY_DN2890_c0_g1_i1.p1  ORF type:complete len:922 (-),score=100.82 TRINITY_DN2890_c0_g1_i1:17-2749(-)
MPCRGRPSAPSSGRVVFLLGPGFDASSLERHLGGFPVAAVITTRSEYVLGHTVPAAVQFPDLRKRVAAFTASAAACAAAAQTTAVVHLPLGLLQHAIAGLQGYPKVPVSVALVHQDPSVITQEGHSNHVVEYTKLFRGSGSKLAALPVPINTSAAIAALHARFDESKAHHLSLQLLRCLGTTLPPKKSSYALPNVHANLVFDASLAPKKIAQLILQHSRQTAAENSFNLQLLRLLGTNMDEDGPAEEPEAGGSLEADSSPLLMTDSGSIGGSAQPAPSATGEPEAEETTPVTGAGGSRSEAELPSSNSPYEADSPHNPSFNVGQLNPNFEPPELNTSLNTPNLDTTPSADLGENDLPNPAPYDLCSSATTKPLETGPPAQGQSVDIAGSWTWKSKVEQEYCEELFERDAKRYEELKKQGTWKDNVPCKARGFDEKSRYRAGWETSDAIKKPSAIEKVVVGSWTHEENGATLCDELLPGGANLKPITEEPSFMKQHCMERGFDHKWSYGYLHGATNEEHSDTPNGSASGHGIDNKVAGSHRSVHGSRGSHSPKGSISNSGTQENHEGTGKEHSGKPSRSSGAQSEGSVHNNGVGHSSHDQSNVKHSSHGAKGAARSGAGGSRENTHGVGHSDPKDGHSAGAHVGGSHGHQVDGSHRNHGVNGSHANYNVGGSFGHGSPHGSSTSFGGHGKENDHKLDSNTAPAPAKGAAESSHKSAADDGSRPNFNHITGSSSVLEGVQRSGKATEGDNKKLAHGVGASRDQGNSISQLTGSKTTTDAKARHVVGSWKWEDNASNVFCEEFIDVGLSPFDKQKLSEDFVWGRTCPDRGFTQKWREGFVSHVDNPQDLSDPSTKGSWEWEDGSGKHCENYLAAAGDTPMANLNQDATYSNSSCTARGYGPKWRQGYTKPGKD